MRDGVVGRTTWRRTVFFPLGREVDPSMILSDPHLFIHLFIYFLCFSMKIGWRNMVDQ